MTFKPRKDRVSPKTQTVEEVLPQAAKSPEMDTALVLMEIYEAVEQTYRAAVMAGEVQPLSTQSTNY